LIYIIAENRFANSLILKSIGVYFFQGNFGITKSKRRCPDRFPVSYRCGNFMEGSFMEEYRKMEYEIVIADPAGNITVFVLDPVERPGDRLALSGAIMADPLLKAEQAGFVVPPQGKGGIWRLEMAGGEFCGNAARSFGLFAAREEGLKGKVSIPVSVSGAEGPVTVNADVEGGWAEAEVPPPLALESLEYSGTLLPAVVFEGITHLIAPDIKPSEGAFKEIMRSLEERRAAGMFPAREKSLAAAGVLFYDRGARFMTPAVYVRATGTLVFESSCGSGSAALGVWESRDLRDGERRFPVTQPGGIIEVRVKKSKGRVESVRIGGAVGLSPIRRRRIHTETAASVPPPKGGKGCFDNLPGD
jgi:diaminopimelate epimerase